MNRLLKVSRIIDRGTEAMGRFVAWAVVAAAVVSASNAILRKLFDMSSNAWLELQWWLFGLVFLFAAPWTLKAGDHIRIDILHNRFSKYWKDRIEIFGTIFFLLPVAAVILFTAWPFALTSMIGDEQSYNAGGLPQWPAKLMIPLAFTALFVQGISQLIKRVAVVRGLIDEPEFIGEDRSEKSNRTENSKASGD